jgi:hypothetical protein
MDEMCSSVFGATTAAGVACNRVCLFQQVMASIVQNREGKRRKKKKKKKKKKTKKSVKAVRFVPHPSFHARASSFAMEMSSGNKKTADSKEIKKKDKKKRKKKKKENHLSSHHFRESMTHNQVLSEKLPLSRTTITLE